MRFDAPDEARAVRYLLGTLPEAEQILVEQEVFSSDDRYEQLLAVEDELMYAYLQDELSADDRRRFEQRFLATAEGQDRAQFAEALLRGLPATQGSGWTRELARWIRLPVFHAGQVPLAAAAVLLLACGWLAIETVALRRDNARLRVEQAASARQIDNRLAAADARADQLAAGLAHEQARRAELDERAGQFRTVISLVLMPGLTRSAGDLHRVVIPSSADGVRIQLELGKSLSYSLYRLAIRTAEGGQVWSEDRPASPSAEFVTFEIPARLLPPNDYELTLQGVARTRRLEAPVAYYLSVGNR